jgi:uncharacterized membrane protein YbhN (UPF0104 family)
MRSRQRAAFAVVQWVLIAAALVWAFKALSAQWQEVRASILGVDIHWHWVLLSSAIVLATYAMLIHSWRILLSGWGSRLPYFTAVRIWTIANLGRYIPGKVWSIGALGVMAKKEGVSGVAAAGAAILGTLLNIGAGFGIMALSGSRTLGAIEPWLQRVAMLVSVTFFVGTLLLPRILPVVLNRVATWKGLPEITRQLPARILWMSTAMNAASWVLYGLAFTVLAKGITPGIAGNPGLMIVIWTASYLSGYLMFLVPGGIGFRDAAMFGALVTLGVAGTADAAVLTLASRVWLTVLELAPGLLALFFHRTSIAAPSIE